MVVAGVLAVFGLLMVGATARTLLASGGVALEDFVPYYGAALRMAAGESPYYSTELDGPIAAVCTGCYLYPPLLAEVLVPLTALPLGAAKVVWLLLLAVLVYASAWIAAGVGGATRSWERALWTVVATTLFFPVFHGLWLGNVSALLALVVAIVAIGGVASGVAASLATLLKASPIVFVPLAFLGGRRSRLTVMVVPFLLLPFVAMAPSAWLETPRVLLNLSVGPADVLVNLAPTAMAMRNDWPELLVTLVRSLTIAGAIVAMLAALWMVRRPGGLPLATLFATVTMLLIPEMLWYHYLVVILPLAAMAWPSAGGWQRPALLVGALATSLAGLNTLPISAAFFSAAFMLAVSAWALWPRLDAVAPYHRSDDHSPAAVAGDA